MRFQRLWPLAMIAVAAANVVMNVLLKRASAALRVLVARGDRLSWTEPALLLVLLTFYVTSWVVRA
jgi:hypothetical protein